MSQLVYTGHVLSTRAIGPAEAKGRAVVGTREPETMSELNIISV